MASSSNIQERGQGQVNSISLVVATYNEASNLPELVDGLCAAFARTGIAGEIIVVDDNSPDGTGRVADDLAARYPLRVVHRPRKMGLASAVVDGFAVAKGDLLGVIDADLSHPPSLVPEMVKAIVERGADLAVASRHVPGGGVKDWPKSREYISAFANLLARPCTGIHDATSGFFLMRRSMVEGVAVNPIGFKIGLEFYVKGRYRRYEEVPYVFTDRRHGKSKFTWREVVNYLRQLVSLMGYRLGRWWTRWRGASPARS